MKFSLVLAASIALAGTASAAEPQHGRWALESQFCNGWGDTHRTAPLIVSATTLTWASEFCVVGKMYKADRGLYIEGRCSNGGMLTRRPIALVMKGERLSVKWSGEQSELRRCP